MDGEASAAFVEVAETFWAHLNTFRKEAGLKCCHASGLHPLCNHVVQFSLPLACVTNSYSPVFQTRRSICFPADKGFILKLRGEEELARPTQIF